MVTIEKAQTKLSARALTLFMRRAQRAVGLTGEVAVLLTDDHRMRYLNREFRGKDQPTDVLSFPATTVRTAGQQCCGDIAISTQIAARSARHYGHSVTEEVKVLMLHGLLHLAGHDHERDSGRMARREQRLRHALRLPTVLTERGDAMVAGTRSRKPILRRPVQ